MLRKLSLLLALLCVSAAAHGQAGGYVSPATTSGATSGPQASNGSAINVKAAPYNALGDTRQIPITVYGAPGFPTGFILNGFPASTFTQADKGKFIGCVENAAGVFRAGGTIVSVDSGTQVTINNMVANGAGGGTGCYLGHFDDTAFAAAYTAAFAGGANNCPLLDGTAQTWNGANCLSLYIPCGGYLLSKPFAAGGIVNTNIRTDGDACTTIFMYSFWDGTSVAANQGAFMTFQGQYADSYTLTASGMNLVLSPASLAIVLYSCVGCEVHGPNVTAVGDNGIILSIAAGGHSVFFNPIVRDPSQSNVAGGWLCDVNGTGSVDIFGIFCSNGFKNLVVRNIGGGSSGSRVGFFGGQIDECGINSLTVGCTSVLTSKDVSFFGTNLIGGANNATPGLSVDGTSEVRIVGGNLGPFAANGGGCATVLSGGKLWYSEINFHASGAGAFCITDQNPVATPGAIDVGGNKYTLANGAVQFSGTARPFGTLTHTYNTCYVTGTFGAVNLCAHFVDQPMQLIRIKASSGVATACTVNPVVTLTDGAASQTLTITTGGTSWDSGAVTSNVIFALGNTLTVSVTAGTCTTPPTNFAVTYNVYASGAQ